MNWPEVLLDYLYENYHPTPTAVNKLFVEKLLNADQESLAQASQAKVVLEELESRGLIEWKVGRWDNREFDSTKSSWYYDDDYKREFGQTSLVGFVPQSFENCRVEARLTHIGHMEVHQRRQEALTNAVQSSTLELNRSALTLNQQLKKHNKWVLGSTIAIVLATVAQAIIAYFSYQQSKSPTPIELKPELNPEIRINEIRPDSVHVIYVVPNKNPPKQNNEKKRSQ